VTAAQDFAALNRTWQRFCEREASPPDGIIEELPPEGPALQRAPIVVLLLMSLCAVERGVPRAGDVIADLVSACAAMVDRMAERGVDGDVMPGELREVMTRLDVVCELRRRERAIDTDQTIPGGEP
jgi:hypothetical protein